VIEQRLTQTFDRTAI